MISPQSDPAKPMLISKFDTAASVPILLYKYVTLIQMLLEAVSNFYKLKLTTKYVSNSETCLTLIKKKC